MKNKTVRGGMIPRVKRSVGALRGGLEEGRIVDGRVARALLLEVFTDSGIGTQISGGE